MARVVWEYHEGFRYYRLVRNDGHGTTDYILEENSKDAMGINIWVKVEYQRSPAILAIFHSLEIGQEQKELVK